MEENDLIWNTGLALDLIRRLGIQAEHDHSFRYVKLIENSTQGFDCKYAVASAKLWRQSGQREVTIAKLRELKDKLDEVLLAYEHSNEEEAP
jgi:hypothetical protein